MKVKPPTPISIETMQAFMVDKGIKAACPHCSVVGWRMVESENTRGAFLQVLADDGSGSGGVLPVAPLVCQNCGNLWIIARQAIEEWMTAQAEKTDE
jgi:hypothetical protein